MTFLIISIYAIIVTITVLGYGLLFLNYFKKIINYDQFNISELGFFGFYALLILSVSIHFFIPINFLVTIPIIFFGVIFFLFNYKFFYKNFSSYYLLAFLYVIYISFNSEGHPDLGWYHLPYMNYLKDFKIIFGIANLNDYLSFAQNWNDILAILRLPLFDFHTINIVSGVFFLFFLIFIIDNLRQENETSLKLFLLLILVFSISKYHKIYEFAGHAPPTILGFIILFYIIKLTINTKNNDFINNNLFKIIIFSSFILVLRINYIILIPTFILIFFLYYKFFLKLFFSKSIFSFILLIPIIIFLKNIITSGCFFYPIYWTCFPTEIFSWGISPDFSKARYELAAALAKGWSFYALSEGNISDRILYLEPLNNGLILNVSDYLHTYKFSWIKYWLISGDSNKILNNFLIIFFCFIILLFSKKNKKTNFKISKKLFFFFFLNICLWIYLTPQSIYGGNLVTVSFAALLASFYLQNINIQNKITISIISFLIFISLFYNISRNLEKFNNFSSNLFSPYFGLIEIEKSKRDTDFQTIYIDGYEIQVKNKIAGRHEGLPDFCSNIKMLCMPIDRLGCVTKIENNFNYIFIKGNSKKCNEMLKSRYFY